MPERGKLRKLFDSTKLMCDAFLQSFLILVSSPLVSSPYPLNGPWIQSRKLKSRYGARNRFQEPSLELSSQAT
jgi:hypothetical protein